MADKRPWPALARALAALAVTAVIGLAVGVVWTAGVLQVPGLAFWLALPAGAFIGYATRRWVVANGYPAAALALLGMLIATGCMSCLYTGARLADAMGLGYVYTLFRAGPQMLSLLTGNLLQHRGHVAIAIGLALAIILALRRPHRTRGDANTVRYRAP